LLPMLAARFADVIGVDFSPAMLARARASCRASHVTLARADLADLHRFHGRLDVAVTVNSVLTPDPDTLDRIFHELARTLRPGGVGCGSPRPSIRGATGWAATRVSRASHRCGTGSCARRSAHRRGDGAPALPAGTRSARRPTRDCASGQGTDRKNAARWTRRT